METAMVASRQFCRGMWLPLALLGGLAVGTHGFSPAPIQWAPGTKAGKYFFVAPKDFANKPLPSSKALPVKLAVNDQSGSWSSGEVPRFIAKLDNTITWDGQDLCVEATGDKAGDAILVNHCTGKENQRWNFMPWRGEQKIQIQLKDTNQCIEVDDEDGGLNGAPLELRECGSTVTEAWKFEELSPLLTQEGSPNISVRYAAISLVAAFGALSLGVFLRRLQHIARALSVTARFNSQRVIPAVGPVPDDKTGNILTVDIEAGNDGNQHMFVQQSGVRSHQRGGVLQMSAKLADGNIQNLDATASAFTGGGPAVASRCPPASLLRAAVGMTMDLTPGETCTGERVTVVGATGYIGKAVVRDLVRRGYPTNAVVRDASKAAAEPKFEGANIVEANVCDPSNLAKSVAFSKGSVDVVISCLASRSGSKSDSYAIDYQATLNCLNAAREAGARHFVMLSAYCVKSAERRDPYALQFQYAKKDMEEALRGQSDITYTIVRPTAFFKSVSGQLEVVNGGAPFVYFDLGNNKCATCNPISEPDLAAALVDTIADKARENALWNIGGPDEGLSMRQQGELVADVLGKEKAKLLGVPIGIFDVIINGLQFLADTFKSQQLEDAAEFGRIGRYYAIEDMLTTDPDERYGRTTLREHYERIAVEGQEYDPYTSVFGSKDAKDEFKTAKQTTGA